MPERHQQDSAGYPHSHRATDASSAFDRHRAANVGRVQRLAGNARRRTGRTPGGSRTRTSAGLAGGTPLPNGLTGREPHANAPNRPRPGRRGVCERSDRQTSYCRRQHATTGQVTQRDPPVRFTPCALPRGRLPEPTTRARHTRACSPSFDSEKALACSRSTKLVLGTMHAGRRHSARTPKRRLRGRGEAIARAMLVFRTKPVTTRGRSGARAKCQGGAPARVAKRSGPTDQ